MAPWHRVNQAFPDNAAADPLGDLTRGLQASPGLAALPPGGRVAIAVGSRGIARIDEVVAATVAALRTRGLQPFIVPAMGSHGGGTAEGQRITLESLGVTESTVGAPVQSFTDSVAVGEVEGVTIFTDRYALENADAIVPIGRVKLHTDFQGPIQSGLLKMLSIGLGNLAAADSVHSIDPDNFSDAISKIGRFLLDRLPVPCGVAIVEDSWDRIGRLEVIEAPDIPTREAELLQLSSRWFPRLPFAEVDLLIVQRMGKNISGAGMDPNVTGRFYRPRPDADLTARYVVVLGLTPETHGNATGIGMADITTRDTADTIDWPDTYLNEITARMLPGAKMPIVAADDREAIGIALHALGTTTPEAATVAYISDTLHTSSFFVSSPLWQQISPVDSLSTTGTATAPRFDAATGRLIVPST